MKTIRLLIGFNVGGRFASGSRSIPTPCSPRLEALDAVRTWKEWKLVLMSVDELEF